MRRFEDPVGLIRVTVGEAFAVALVGNPNTGYNWQATVDAQHLELLMQEFEMESKAVGAGGRDVFRFRALETGETHLAFEYRRPWGGQVLDIRRIGVIIARL